ESEPIGPMGRSGGKNSELLFSLKARRSHKTIEDSVFHLMKLKDEPEMGEALDAPEGLGVEIIFGKMHFTDCLGYEQRLSRHAEFFVKWSLYKSYRRHKSNTFIHQKIWC